MNTTDFTNDQKSKEEEKVQTGPKRTRDQMLGSCTSTQKNQQSQKNEGKPSKRWKMEDKTQLLMWVNNQQSTEVLKTQIIRMVQRMTELEVECRELTTQNTDLKSEIGQLKAVLQQRETLMDFFQDQINQKLISTSQFMEAATNYITRIVNPLLVYKQNRQIKERNQQLLKEIQFLKKYQPSLDCKDEKQNIVKKIRPHQFKEEKNAIEQKQAEQKMKERSAFSKKKAVMIQAAESQGIKFLFQWDRIQCYDMKMIEYMKGLKVRRISKNKEQIASMDSTTQIVYVHGGGGFTISKNSLPKIGKHKVTFRIIQNRRKQPIVFGIMTHEKKNSGNLYGEQKELISYSSHSNRMGAFALEQKVVLPFSDNDLGAPQGGCIQMVVDSDKSVIQFTRTAIPDLKIENKITTGVMGQSFRNTGIYVYVRLQNPGDCIDIV